MPALLTEQGDLFYRFGVALIIGILIGLERERAADANKRELFAGIRTMSLLALAGCMGALLTDLTNSPWPLVAVILTLGALIAAAYYSLSRGGEFGGTSEVAALLAVLTGALCYFEYIALAAALAVITTVLLSLKNAMHSFAQRLSANDVYATLKFAVITAIILPVLPNTHFGPSPFDALNPYHIWLMVVFISGISFTGYVLIQLVDVRNGVTLTGVLGGLVSSTAVTLSFGQRSRRQPALSVPFATAITIAWAMMFLRVMIVVGVVNLQLLGRLWLPLAAAAISLFAYAALLFMRQSNEHDQSVELVNPFELTPALTFGAFYALILLITRAAQMYLGNAGIYLSSIVAGLVDVNAISLSIAELSVPNANLAPEIGGPAVILAVLANTLVKSGMVFTTGSPGLRRALLPAALLGLTITAGMTFLR